MCTLPCLEKVENMKNTMDIGFLESILTLPTSPFHEDVVSDFIREWAQNKPFQCSTDNWGNVSVTYSNGGSQHWVLAAHMDHPGFEAISQDGSIVTAWFRGGVRDEYYKGSSVTFLRNGSTVNGTIVSAKRDLELRWVLCSIELESGKTVEPGTPGMWNIPSFSKDNDLIRARVCDDLAGVAAIMEVLDQLAVSKASCHCTALFTRAEEVGFVGAIAACKERSIPDDAHVIAVETSKAQPGAGHGDGVVIRVGDKASVFTPELTGYVTHIAGELKKQDDSFKFVRMLMPGGTCESTVYCASGYSATGLCLALGNYHNMGANNQPQPEEINYSDYEALVTLMKAVVVSTSSPRELAAKWLESVHKKYDSLTPYL